MSDFAVENRYDAIAKSNMGPTEMDCTQIDRTIIATSMLYLQ